MAPLAQVSDYVMINLFKLYKVNFFREELKIISVVLASKKKKKDTSLLGVPKGLNKA